MLKPSSTLRLLDELQFRAWPAAEVRDVGGWMVRSMDGITRRGNSVWPVGWSGQVGLGEAVARVERFYESHNRRTLFQICPSAEPDGLDVELARRSYAIEAPVHVLTTEASALSARLEGSRPAEVSDTPPQEWLDLAGRRGRFAEHRPALYGLVSRLVNRSGFGVVKINAEPVASGLAVVEGTWAGIFALNTVERYRRRGAASGLLRGLALWAWGRGATSLYLQVEDANAAARALFDRLGFREACRYHYRIK